MEHPGKSFRWLGRDESGVLHDYDSEDVTVECPFWQHALPAGIIVMWAGTLATIPADWLLCDGQNGTPDLQDRFVRGADHGEDPGDIGGQVEHGPAEAYAVAFIQKAA